MLLILAAITVHGWSGRMITEDNAGVPPLTVQLYVIGSSVHVGHF